MKFSLALAACAATCASWTGTALAATMTVDAPRAAVRDLGRATAATPVTVSVVLAFRNESELEQLIALQSDPQSRLYRQFLTRDQFEAAFGPAPGARGRVAAALVRAGFRLTNDGTESVVSAVAPAPVAERYFGTEIHRVLQPGAGERYANLRPAVVPAELARDASTVVGLDSLRGATPDYVFLPRPSQPLLPDKISGKHLTGPDGGYGPFAVAQGFDYPVQHGFDGKGHAIAIAIDYDSSDSDLNAFATYFDIKRTGKDYHVPVDGGSPYNPNNAVETMLDVETVGTLDPGADVYTYDFGAAFTFKDISDAYAKIVSDNKVDVVNSSFGLCEDNAPQSFVSAVQAATKQGAAEGITFVSSTGDYGRGGKCQDGTGQDVPAVLTYFTSVGGVDLTVNAKGMVTSEPEDSGSGGGPSDIYPIPKYQVGVPGIFSTTKRNIPDVSGPFQPDSFYLGGRFQGPIGGTSWASPATAAFIAEENQVEGKRIGFANPTIYHVFKKHGYNVFNDITSGNNGIACAKGYDDCSGIGTLKAFPLAQAI